MNGTTNKREELARRENDGLEVSLVWCRETDSVAVEVIDTRSGDAFELVLAGEDALDVFEHPYAYAAFRGVEYGDGTAEAAEVEAPPVPIRRLLA